MVLAAQFLRLIAPDSVASGGGFKLQARDVLDSDFHMASGHFSGRCVAKGGR